MNERTKNETIVRRMAGAIGGFVVSEAGGISNCHPILAGASAVFTGFMAWIMTVEMIK